MGTTVQIFSNHSKAMDTKPSFASILKCFSLIRNTAILLGNKAHDTNKCGSLTKQNSASDYKKNVNNIEHKFSYLHGIRTILLLWILAAHAVSLIPTSIIMPVSLLSRHPHDMVQMAKNNGIFGNFFNNGTLAVEAFFLIR